MIKIKKLLMLAALPAALLSLAACDEVADGDRYIELPQVTAQRTVLLEEFTGQECVNCPAAHEVIESLLAQYGDALIAVSIHGGYFGIPISRVGLMQPEGNEYVNHWGAESFPSGVVNRMGGVQKVDAWSASIRSLVGQPASLNITVEAHPSADGKQIDITTTLNPQDNLQSKLQLWITEDNIVARQRNAAGKWVSDYVHNHVYRASVNGTWGEDITLSEGVHKTLSHSIAVREETNETWNVANLHVVAFVYNDGGVLQAAQCSVVSEGDTGENQNIEKLNSNNPTN